jgi:hypothetical protein
MITVARAIESLAPRDLHHEKARTVKIIFYWLTGSLQRVVDPREGQIDPLNHASDASRLCRTDPGIAVLRTNTKPASKS